MLEHMTPRCFGSSVVTFEHKEWPCMNCAPIPTSKRWPVRTRSGGYMPLAKWSGNTSGWWLETCVFLFHPIWDDIKIDYILFCLQMASHHTTNQKLLVKWFASVRIAFFTTPQLSGVLLVPGLVSWSHQGKVKWFGPHMVKQTLGPEVLGKTTQNDQTWEYNIT